MLLRFIKTIPSMLTSSQRPQGRSWFSELAVRSTRNLFIESTQHDVAWLRKQVNKVPYNPIFSKVSFSTRELAGVPCMLLSPKAGASSDNVVVYLHGGGYVAGSPTSHKSILAEIAIATQGLVIAPDYRLSPEHRFPIPQDDCLNVARLVLKTYGDKRVTLAGDSAGGALAIATAQSIANDTSMKIDKLVLLSPWVEPTAVGGSIKTNEKVDYLIGSFLGESFSELVDEQDFYNERVNFANADLSNLPQTLIHYGGSELFVDQIVKFAERAEQAGVDLTLKEFAAQCHVFQLFSVISSDAKNAMTEISEFIKAG